MNTEALSPDLLGLALLFAVDRLVTPRVTGRPWLFWPLVGLDVAVAAYVMLFGLPGVEGLWVVRWLVAILLVFHAVQNVSTWDRTRKAQD